MEKETIERIFEHLPEFFCRCKQDPLWFQEELMNWVSKTRPPDRDVICEKKGFFRKIEIGEFDTEYDVIIIYPEHYVRLAPLFKAILDKIGCTNIPILNTRTPPSELDYQERVMKEEK